MQISHPQSSVEQLLAYNMALYQINSISNIRGKFLDLIFTRSNESEVAEPTPLIKIDDYHLPLLLSMEWYPNVFNDEPASPPVNFR